MANACLCRGKVLCLAALATLSGASRIQRAGLVDASLGLVRGRAALADEASANSSWTASYCYENSNFDGCWDQKPQGAPPCSASSGKAPCFCADMDCNVDELDRTPKAIGTCERKLVYVADGESHTDSNGTVQVTGTSSEAYCVDMIKSDEWTEMGLLRSVDYPESNGASWKGCWSSSYTWKDDRCQARTRYLGESCWDGSFGRGRCAVASDGGSVGQYSLSCYEGKCVPHRFARKRNECTCKMFGWNFLLVCSARDGACNGHACVWNSGNGKKYCDYASSQNW